MRMGWGNMWEWEEQDQREGGQLGVVALQVRSDGSRNTGSDAGDRKGGRTKVPRH